MSGVTISEKELQERKDKRDQLMREAQKAAHEYAVECELGSERTAAFTILENLTNAGRVY